MDKIYSRKRLIIPKINISIFHKRHKPSFEDNNKAKKILQFLIIIIIAICTMIKIVEGINPIIDKQCQTNAKSIATKISNEQATIVMKRYNYDDMCNVTRDSSRKYCYD